VRFAPADPAFQRERWLAIGLMLLALVAWEWASRAGALSTLFFPPPSEVWRALRQTAASGDLMRHLGATLSRVLLGILAGGGPGLLLGLVLGESARLRAFVDPFIATFHPIPKIAMLPFIMMVFGVGEASKIVVVAVATFFPLLLTTMAGVRQIQEAYFDIAAAYGATRIQTFVHVVLPGSLPFALTGLRLSFNIGLVMSIAVEIATARVGLGRMIWFAWETMRIENLYATLAVLAALGVSFNLLLSWITERLVPWRPDRTR
jgi:NitT/TauT family transport system permease protein